MEKSCSGSHIQIKSSVVDILFFPKTIPGLLLIYLRGSPSLMKISLELFKLAIGQAKILNMCRHDLTKSMMAAILFFRLAWKTIPAFILLYLIILPSLVTISPKLFKLLIGQAKIYDMCWIGIKSSMAAILFFGRGPKTIPGFLRGSRLTPNGNFAN